MKLRSAALVLASSVSVLAALACNSDDTGLTARTQSHVNQAVTPDSTIQVNVDDGVVTLSGVASSDVAHAHALAAARATEGVEQVVDHIATPTSLTGGTVKRQ
jgi:osmotically-inducible protein OsmY